MPDICKQTLCQPELKPPARKCCQLPEFRLTESPLYGERQREVLRKGWAESFLFLPFCSLVPCSVKSDRSQLWRVFSSTCDFPWQMALESRDVSGRSHLISQHDASQRSTSVAVGKLQLPYTKWGPLRAVINPPEFSWVLGPSHAPRLRPASPTPYCFPSQEHCLHHPLTTKSSPQGLLPGHPEGGIRLKAFWKQACQTIKMSLRISSLAFRASDIPLLAV